MAYRTAVLWSFVLCALLGATARAGSASLRTYLSITDVAWESGSPDGARIAYTSQESGTWQVWVTTLEGSHRRRLTYGKDAVDFATWIPNDEHAILYASSHGGNGNDQFSYVRDDRPGSVALFPHESNVRHVFGAFSTDGSKLAFSSNRRKASAFDVYVLDRATGNVRRVYTTEGTAYAAAWSPDGRELLVRRVTNPYDDDLYAVDLRTGAARLLTPHAGQANFDNAHFAADMRSVICISDTHREYRTIQRIDLATLAVKPVLTLHHDVDEVALSPDGHRMAYIVNRDGYGEVIVANASDGREIGRPAMPPSIAETLQFAAGGRRLLYDAEGPTFPKVVWAYDLESRKTTRILRPDLHGIAPGSIVEPQVVHVKSFDGTIVPAWYFRPRSARGKLTVLLDIHGGPEEQDRAWFYPWAQYLVSRGYALLDPNIRGSTGYGRTYLHMAGGRKREGAVDDVAALRAWLIRAGGANPKAVFVDGASYGGFVTMSCMYRYPHAWAGGIDVYGPVDMVDFLRKTAPDRRSGRQAIYGSLVRDRSFLAAISPINHLAEIERPVLIVGGANDPIVPIAQSEHLAQALRRHGVPVELHVFADEGHGFSHVDDLVTTYQAMLAFVRRYAPR